MAEPPSSPFPKWPPAMEERDTASVGEIVEAQRIGETNLDAIAKAQSSSPQVVERMVKLEESLWSLAQLLLKLPDELKSKLGAEAEIERARALLLESIVMNHNLALADPDRASPASDTDWTVLNLSKRLRDSERGG
jgi:hypothetical protein